MARPVPENPSDLGTSEASTSMSVPPDSIRGVRKWYFTRQEIEESPSRKDGVSLKHESQLRKLYCMFLQEIGVKLKVPQPTISCAMMLCHQFFMRQSHAKNGWQAVATASIFLACKTEDTPHYLNDVVFVAYEMIHKRDPSALQRIRDKEFLNKQKDFILVAERVLLSTIGFDLNIQLPYNILVTALKNLGLLPDLSKAAWNFVNDCLGTSLCLEYKPHYIAAGSIALAAKFQNVKLPKVNGKAWWMELDVAPKQLEEVFQRMHSLCKAVPPKTGQIVQPEALSQNPTDDSPQSCVSSENIVEQHSKHKGLGGESAVSLSKECIRAEDNTGKDALPCHGRVVKDGSEVIKPSRCESDDRRSRFKIPDVPKRCGEIEMNQIRELKRSRCDKGEENTEKDAMPRHSSVVEDGSRVIKPVRGESEDQRSRRKVLDVPKRCGEIEMNRNRELKRSRCDRGEENTEKYAMPCRSSVKDESGVIKPLRGESDDQSSRHKIRVVPKRCGEIETNQIRELKQSICDKGEENTEKYAMPCRSTVAKDGSGAIKPLRAESNDQSSRPKVLDLPKRCEIELNQIRELRRSRCDKGEQSTDKYAMPCRSSVVKDGGGVIKPSRGESDDRSLRCKFLDVPRRCGDIEMNQIREAKKRSDEGVNKKTAGSITEEQLEDASAAKKQRRVYSTSMMLSFRDIRQAPFMPLCRIQVCRCCSFD